MKIIFVCTGNTCRSPMAESIAKKLLPEHEIQSRGIYALDGSEPSSYTRQILIEEDFEAPANAKQLDQIDLTADLILTMSASHKDYIKSVYDKPLNVYTLYEYVKLDGEVSDPFGGDYSDYQRIYNELYYLITELKHRIDFM